MIKLLSDLLNSTCYIRKDDIDRVLYHHHRTILFVRFTKCVWAVIQIRFSYQNLEDLQRENRMKVGI